MRQSVGTLVFVRAAVALLLVTASGATQVAAMHAPAAQHRCSCKHETERGCDCGACRRRALEAREADDASPPCHREAARNALAAEAHRRGSPSVPCMDGACGGRGDPTTTMPSSEPYVLPADLGVPPRLRSERLTTLGRAAPARTVAPEPPPPRAA